MIKRKILSYSDACNKKQVDYQDLKNFLRKFLGYMRVLREKCGYNRYC